MAGDSATSRRGRLMLAADGCLVTAGTFALMIGTAFGLDASGVAPLGEPSSGGLGVFLSIVSWLLQVGGFVVGPVIVWWFHRLRFEKVDILALVGGFAIGGALVLPVAMLGAAVDWFVGLFTSVEYVGAIAYLVVVSIAFLVAAVWSGIDAFRDLSTARRHMSLDVARLAAVLAAVVFAVLVTREMLAGEDAVEALAFLLLAGFQGAAVVSVADVASRFMKLRAAAGRQPISPA